MLMLGARPRCCNSGTNPWATSTRSRRFTRSIGMAYQEAGNDLLLHLCHSRRWAPDFREREHSRNLHR
jgi:hypothetical protein